jgi:hypothetical protein
MANTGTYKFNSTGMQQFPYYSGSQISIWFGDIWIDDVKSITWTYNQSKGRLFGYASQQFDSVAEGLVDIQGGFTINFRDRGYITYVLQNIKRLYKTLSAMKSHSDLEFDMRSVKEAISMHLKNGTFGPKTYDELIGMASDGDFFEKAKVYEDAIWGDDEKRKRESGFIETPDIFQHGKFPDGFDIMITYGNVGSVKNYTIEDVYSSTIKTLNGVHLTGSQQWIDVGGEPIEETYSFFARGMDEFVDNKK